MPRCQVSSGLKRRIGVGLNEHRERAARNALEVEQANERSHVLMEVLRVFSTELDADRLLTTIVACTSKAIQADRSSLFLIDFKTNELWSKVAQGDEIAEIRIPCGAGIVGHVAATGETIRITDAYQDARFDPDVDKNTGYHTRDILCVAMRDETGRIVGAVECINKLNGTFTVEDEDLLDALAVQSNVALRVAHAVQARERQLQQQVIELQIKVDEARQSSQVSEIIGTDYFQYLQAKVAQLKTDVVNRRTRNSERPVEERSHLE
ncbi:MAG: GAF domain-containing protein [Chloroflexi bacterium]|nr:GAF domain-containing protein [Chloroflexota bacterium]